MNKLKEMQQKDSSLISSFYWVIGLVIIATFMQSNEYMAQSSLFPAIPLPKGLTIMAFAVIFTIFLVIRHRKILSFDLIAILLVLYAALSAITSVIYQEASIGRVLIYILSLLSYFIGSQTKKENLMLVAKAYLCFGVFLSLQTLISSAVILFNNPHGYEYSSMMRIPAAASNVIASYISPAVFILLGTKMKRLIKSLLMSVLLFGLVASSSRAGVVITGMMLIVYFLCQNSNSKITEYIKSRALIIGVFSIILIAAAGYLAGGNMLEILSNGRFELAARSIEQWIESPIIGVGTVYPDGFAGTHNLLIELLRESGIIGFCIYSAALVIVFRKVFPLLTSKLFRGLPYAILVLFAFANVDTNYFNFTHDYLFWFLAGAIVSISASLTRPTREASSNRQSDDRCISSELPVEYGKR